MTDLTVFLFFRPNFEEDSDNFAVIKNQAEMSWSNLHIFEIDIAAY